MKKCMEQLKNFKSHCADRIAQRRAINASYLHGIMSSPKPSRLATNLHPAKHSPSTSSRTANDQKAPSSELNKWIDAKLREWETGKQERDIRVTRLVDSAQATARERNKSMEDEINKMRDEFDQKMAESKKIDTHYLDTQHVGFHEGKNK